MLIGRFLMIVPIMALAGSLAQKKIAPPSAGTFPVSGGTFVVSAARHGAARRRAELPARADARPDRRALPIVQENFTRQILAMNRSVLGRKSLHGFLPRRRDEVAEPAEGF